MENRYEEYSSRPDGVPFVFSSRLHRSAIHASREANWHGNIEIQLCDGGEGSVLLDGRRISFSRGETAVINTGVIHHTGTEGELTYSCLIMDAAFCLAAGIDPATLRFEEHFCDPSLDIAAICEQGFLSPSGLQRAFLQRFGISPKQYIIKLRMNKALQLLAENRLPVKAVALSCGFSDEKYFSRAFREKYGYPPSRLRDHIVV